MKKIAVAFLLVCSSTFAQEGSLNTESSVLDKLEKVIEACLVTIQTEQVEVLSRFINTHDGELNKYDIMNYQSDLNIVARIKARSCAMKSMSQQ